MDIAIIADDLSGANDTAVAFRKHGIKTCVVNYPEGFENELADCDLLSVSTNTRDLEPSEAEIILRDVTQSLMKVGVRRVYKKMDSTWRGNIGREIQTIMEELNVNTAVICSSFPDVHRTIKDGHLYVSGKPIEHTPIAFDPCKPMKTSYLPEILQAQTDLPVHLLNYEDVEKGSVYLSEKIQTISNGKKVMFIADAIESNDLEIIAAIDTGDGNDVLFCGSAGLSNAMLNAEKVFEMPKMHPVMVIVGSVHPVNQELIHQTVQQHKAVAVRLDPCQLLRGSVDKTTKEKAHHVMEEGYSIIIHTGQSEADRKETKEYGRDLKLSEGEISLRINQAVQDFVNELLEQYQFAGFIVTGGTTALHFLRGIRGAGIRMVDEIEIGVPFGTVIGGPMEGAKIITKAGGFGSRNTFIDSIERLQKNICVKGEK